MAKAAPQRRAASFMPDDLVSGGRPSGFWAPIKEFVLLPYNFEKRERDQNDPTKGYNLCYRLTLTPDEGQPVTEEVIERGFSGWLNRHVPSEDGATPSMDIEDYIALSKGEKRLDGDEVEQYKGHFALPLEMDDSSDRVHMLKDTVHSQLTTAFLNTGFVPEDGADLSSYEGIRFFWELQDQIRKPGAKSDKKSTVLVPTDWDNEGGKKSNKSKSSASASKPSTAKPAPVAASDDSDSDGSSDELSEFDHKVITAIKSIIAANNGSIPRKNLLAKFASTFKGKDLNPAVALVKSAGSPLLESQNGVDWIYDAEGDTLIGLE